MGEKEHVLQVVERDGVVTLTLNRPARLNALNEELLQQLVSALRAIPESARAVVLRGNGRAFCAGYDLKEAAARPHPPTAEELRSLAELIQDVTRGLRTCPVPVIGVVHGYAVGAGCELALICDLVLAGDGAKFAFPETAAGLVVTNGVTSTLPKTLGPARAKELILLGEEFSASEALALGIVNRVVADDELDEELARVLEKLAQKTTLALRIAKRLIDQGIDSDLETTLAREVDAAVEAELSHEAQYAMRTIIERKAGAAGAGGSESGR